MKMWICFAAFLIAAAPGECGKETEETEVAIVPGEEGYIKEDIDVQKARTDWQEFTREADSIILSSRIQISEANDCYDNTDTPNRGKLKSAIIKAEARLEALSDMMLRGRKFSQKDFRFDRSALEEIGAFKQEFELKREQLNESLARLKGLY